VAPQAAATGLLVAG